MLIIRRLVLFFGVWVYAAFPLLAQSNLLQNPTQDAYQWALNLYRKEQYGNAQQYFDDIWVNTVSYDQEKRSSACYYAAQCAMHLYNGDVKERIAEFDENFALSPLSNQLYLNYANNLFSIKRYREASDYYEKVDRYALSPKFVDEFQFKKGYAYFNNNRQKEASDIFRDLKEKESPYANSARYYYAHMLYADSSYREALKNFLPLQDDASFGALVPYYLAHIYYSLNDYDKLLEVGEDLITKASPARAPEIAKLMADAFYDKSDYKSTVKYLEIYDEKGGKMRVTDHFQKGYAYYQIKDYFSAIESFNKIAKGPEDLRQNTYYHLGDCHLKIGEKFEARTAFKAASELAASPEIQEDAYFNYAKLAYELADPFQDAISTLNKFLASFPNSKHSNKINYYLANLYITTKDYGNALKAIERHGLKDKNMQQAYQKIMFYKANELFNDRKYIAALKKYEESLAYPISQKYNALSKYWMAESHYQLKEYSKALEYYQDFRLTNGASSLKEFNKSFYSTAYCYYKMFDLPKSVSDFKSFIRDSRNKRKIADTYLRLGDCYLLTGAYIIASDYYTKALVNNTPKADYAYFQRAACKGLDGKKKEKIKELRKLIKLYPNSAYAEESHFEIAITYLRLDDYNNSLNTLNEFKSQYPQSERLAEVELKKGLIYSNLDKNNMAIVTFKEIVEEYPGSQESIEAISLAEFAFKREQRFDEYLDWVQTISFVNFEESELDSTAYNVAFDLYSMAEYKDAINSFQNYLSRFKNGIFQLKAQYYSAQSNLYLNEYNKALEHYRVIANMPFNQYSTEAYKNVAEAELDTGNYVNARDWFNKVEANAKDANYLLAAKLGNMVCNYELGAYEVSLNYAKTILAAVSDNHRALSDARLIKARSLFNSGLLSDALYAYEQVKNLDDGKSKAEAYYQLAVIKSQEANYDSSNAEINAMIEELPSYKEWKLKGLLLMAKNFWKLDDIFQANYILDFIIDSDFSEELNTQALQLKSDIALAESEELEAKKKLIEEQSEVLKLDAENGILLIDAPEEEEEEDLTENTEK